MEQFITAGNCALRVADTKKGDRCAILLHGYLESLDVWDDLTALLAPDIRVVAPDLPGHGISLVMGEVHTMEMLADTVVAVMDRQGIDKACMVGHSLGGYVALAMAELHPERMSAIVMLSSMPYPDDQAKKEERQREIKLVKAGKKDLIGELATDKGFAPQNRVPMTDLIDQLKEQVALTEDEGVVAMINGMEQRADRREILTNLRVPKLFIFGRHDVYIDLPTAQQMTAENPDAEVLWLENSGHNAMLEQPEECAEAIRKIMERVTI